MKNYEIEELIGPCGEKRREKRLLLWPMQLAQLVARQPDLESELPYGFNPQVLPINLAVTRVDFNHDNGQIATRGIGIAQTSRFGTTVIIGDLITLPETDSNHTEFGLLTLRPNGILDIWGERTSRGNPRVRTTWGRRIDKSTTNLDQVMRAAIVKLLEVTHELRESQR